MPKQTPKWGMNSALGKLAFLTHIKVRDCSVTRAWGRHGGVNAAGGGQVGAICSALKDDTEVVMRNPTRQDNMSMMESARQGNECCCFKF